MPHLAGKCDCGRSIHLPKNAEQGYQWTCYKCGKTWTLSTHGKPLHTQGSLPPSENSSNSSGSSGCLVIFAIPIIFLLLAASVLAG